MDRAAIVQKAIDELQNLHEGLERRCAEFHGIREAEIAECDAGRKEVQAQQQEQLDSLQGRIAAHEAEVLAMREEIAAEEHTESAAQEAELRLLAAASAGGGAEAELQTLRQELAASEHRGAALAALLG